MARALKTKTSEEVIDQLHDIYLDVGLPSVIQHDQRTEFTSNWGQNLLATSIWGLMIEKLGLIIRR